MLRILVAIDRSRKYPGRATATFCGSFHASFSRGADVQGTIA
jgi:hypothetical protein